MLMFCLGKQTRCPYPYTSKITLEEKEEEEEQCQHHLHESSQSRTEERGLHLSPLATSGWLFEIFSDRIEWIIFAFPSTL